MENFTYKDLNIVYEDNHIIVVVKPQNLPTQSDSSGNIDLLSLLKEYVKNTYNKEGDAYVGMVQRLDRPTGGVMVFARTSKAAARLSAMLKDKSNDEGDEQPFEKTYYAVLCGEPKKKQDKLVHYILKNPLKNVVQAVPMSTQGAKRAELDYKVIEVVKGYSLVKINLITGRPHQARVQMSIMGTPIFGDAKYGAEERTHKFNLALWAAEIKFNHPVTQQRMTFRVYPPKELSPWKAFDISRHLSI